MAKGLAGDAQRFQRADINALLAEVVAMTRPPAARQGVDVAFRSAPLPAVRCDPVQIQQVCLNLVRNAVDAVVEKPRKPCSWWTTTRRCGTPSARSWRRRAWFCETYPEAHAFLARTTTLPPARHVQRHEQRIAHGQHDETRTSLLPTSATV